MFTHQYNERVTKALLTAAYQGDVTVLDKYIAADVKCWGFPEFSPQNRNEYKGFFNYMVDAFYAMEFTIEQMLADESQVLVRFRINGIHHEEFMGLPATGSQIEFTATALYRLTQGMISETWMYNKAVTLITHKGLRYQLNNSRDLPDIARIKPKACSGC